MPRVSGLSQQQVFGEPMNSIRDASHILRWHSWVIGCLLSLTLTHVWGQSLDRVIDFDIPAQPMNTALVQFGKQAGLQVVSSGHDLEGVSGREVKGRVSVRDAIDRLLEGTGLVASLSGTDTLVVQLAAGKARQKSSGTAPAEVAASVTRSNNDVHVAEQLMVTATKREERFIDVPLSIGVVTRQEIDRRGLTGGEDYLRGMPGVNQVESGHAGQSIIIRGIETSPQTQNFSSGANVATFFGETPTTNSEGLSGSSNIDLKLVDIERVEVLRGPQGTAFGSSSMGGTVRTIPVAPNLTRIEGTATASYSVTSGTGGDNYNVQGVLNAPLVENKISVRAVAYQFQDSGYYRNRAGSDAAFQAASVVPYGVQAYAKDQDEVGSTRTIGGRVSALFRASDELKFSINLLSQRTETDGVMLANAGGYDQTLLGVAPQHVIRGQTGGALDKSIDIANAVGQYDLGWGDLLATYSHTKSGTTQSDPFAATAGFNYPGSTLAPSHQSMNVGEIRLTTRLDGAWNFLGGLFASERKDDVNFNYLWFGDASRDLFNPGQTDLGSSLESTISKERAAFGEATWEIRHGLTLTGGMRAYHYEKSSETGGTGIFGGGGDGALHPHGELADSGTTFRGNLSYKLDDATLFYGGFSQGFRLGNKGAPLSSSVCDRNGDGIVDGTNIPIAGTGIVKSDSVNNFEIGWKFDGLEHRLLVDADIFRMNWKDIPVQVKAGTVTTGCGLNYLTNAGEALSQGLEFQVRYQVSKPWLVTFGGSLIDAKLTTDVPAQGFVAGDRLPGSPRVTANLGAQYEFLLEGHKGFIRADSIYVGSSYGDIKETPNTKTDAYVKLDMTARMQFEKMNVDLFVTNLTNDDAFTYRGIANGGPQFGYRLRPRTVGLRAAYNF